MNFETETYNPAECAVFYRTRDEHGALSNMAAGYPIRYCDIWAGTSEALYQACRYPDHPNIQEGILKARGGMGAKATAKEHKKLTREDWETVRIPIMAWVLQMKLSQNFEKMYKVYQNTQGKMIVEKSRRDSFWGAIEQITGKLRGQNVLGRLHVSLRDRAFKDPHILRQYFSPADYGVRGVLLLGLETPQPTGRQR